MAKKTGFIVTKSNYSLRKKHQKSPDGDIFVRDYMTNTTPGAWSSDVFSYGESNFKLVGFNKDNQTRLHKYGDWKNNPCGEELWTLGCLVDENTDSDIKLNYDYGSMDNFVYFGSCIETLENSIKNIINKYPAEIYVTNERRYSYDAIYEHATQKGGFSNPVDVSNPFDIDILTEKMPVNGNIFRCLGISYNNYQVRTDAETNIMDNAFDESVENGDNLDWEGEYYNCNVLETTSSFLIKYEGKSKIRDNFYIMVYSVTSNNGDVRWYYVADGSNSGKHICLKYNYYTLPNVSNVTLSWGADNVVDDKKLLPTTGVEPYTLYALKNINGEKYYSATKKDGSIKWVRTNIEHHNPYKEFFNNLTPFETLLLNRNSKPIYVAYIEYPFETDEGIKTYKRHFGWPLNVGEWNLDFESIRYTNYVGELMKIASLYDEYKTDNLWGQLTHDSIKNMDHTFVNDKTGEDKEDFRIGTTRMKMLLSAYSIIFDDIKRYIDNIKNTNNITYDNYNNLPDYLLSDNLEMSGWEIYNIADNFDKNAILNSGDYFSGEGKLYTTTDINIKFLKNLKMNSKNILNSKGTKHSIEKLLSLFGFVSADFKRNYDKYEGNDATYLPTYELSEYICIATPKKGNASTEEVEKYNSYKLTYDDLDDDTLQGLPITIVEVNGKRIIVPYYDKNSTYDGGIYYQMKGGWECDLNRAVKSYVTYLPKDEIVALHTKYGDEIFNGNTDVDTESLDNLQDCIIRISGGFYRENLKRLGTVRTVSELSQIPLEMLHNGDIYMVTGEEDEFVEDYNTFFGVSYDPLTNSRYFCVKNKNYSNSYGVVDTDIISAYTYTNESGFPVVVSTEKEVLDAGFAPKPIYVKTSGWTNVEIIDLINGVDDGAKVLYLLDTVDDIKGNAPHIGYGYYDGGIEYYKYLHTVFKDAIDRKNFSDDAYDCDNKLLEDIKNFGFENIFSKERECTKYKYSLDRGKTYYSVDNEEDVPAGATGKKSYTDICPSEIEKKKDNVKCWYFYEKNAFESAESSNSLCYVIDRKTGQTECSPLSLETECSPLPPEEEGRTKQLQVRNYSKYFYNGDSTTEGNYYYVGGNTNEVGATWSTLNTKFFKILFKEINIGTTDEEKKRNELKYEYFIQHNVMPYVRQLIPSTTIVEYSFAGRVANRVKRLDDEDRTLYGEPSYKKKIQYDVREIIVTYIVGDMKKYEQVVVVSTEDNPNPTDQTINGTFTLREGLDKPKEYNYSIIRYARPSIKKNREDFSLKDNFTESINFSADTYIRTTGVATSLTFSCSENNATINEKTGVFKLTNTEPFEGNDEVKVTITINDYNQKPISSVTYKITVEGTYVPEPEEPEEIETYYYRYNWEPEYYYIEGKTLTYKPDYSNDEDWDETKPLSTYVSGVQFSIKGTLTTTKYNNKNEFISVETAVTSVNVSDSYIKTPEDINNNYRRRGLVDYVYPDGTKKQNVPWCVFLRRQIDSIGEAKWVGIYYGDYIETIKARFFEEKGRYPTDDEISELIDRKYVSYYSINDGTKEGITGVNRYCDIDDITLDWEVNKIFITPIVSYTEVAKYNFGQPEPVIRATKIIPSIKQKEIALYTSEFSKDVHYVMDDSGNYPIISLIDDDLSLVSASLSLQRKLQQLMSVSEFTLFIKRKPKPEDTYVRFDMNESQYNFIYSDEWKKYYLYIDITSNLTEEINYDRLVITIDGVKGYGQDIITKWGIELIKNKNERKIYLRCNALNLINSSEWVLSLRYTDGNGKDYSDNTTIKISKTSNFLNYEYQLEVDPRYVTEYSSQLKDNIVAFDRSDVSVAWTGRTSEVYHDVVGSGTNYTIPRPDYDETGTYKLSLAGINREDYAVTHSYKIEWTPKQQVDNSKLKTVSETVYVTQDANEYYVTIKNESNHNGYILTVLYETNIENGDVVISVDKINEYTPGSENYTKYEDISFEVDGDVIKVIDPNNIHFMITAKVVVKITKNSIVRTAEKIINFTYSDNNYQIENIKLHITDTNGEEFNDYESVGVNEYEVPFNTISYYFTYDLVTIDYLGNETERIPYTSETTTFGSHNTEFTIETYNIILKDPEEHAYSTVILRRKGMNGDTPMIVNLSELPKVYDFGTNPSIRIPYKMNVSKMDKNNGWALTIEIMYNDGDALMSDYLVWDDLTTSVNGIDIHLPIEGYEYVDDAGETKFVTDEGQIPDGVEYSILYDKTVKFDEECEILFHFNKYENGIVVDGYEETQNQLGTVRMFNK